MDRVSSHPVLGCAEAKAWEAALLTDEAAEWSAMQRAATAIAGAVAEDFKEIGGLPADAWILVLAGKGHNGGDALLAARALLMDRPAARAIVVLPFGADKLRPLAARSLDALHRAAAGRVGVLTGEEALGADRTYALCLDGLFGFQFRPPMDAAAGALIDAVNRHKGIRLRAAVDLPSGVGRENAPMPFRADFTYATGMVKAPVLSPAAAGSVGRLRYLDLGFFAAGEPEGVTERMLTPQLLTPLGALRPAQTDKRTFGHLFVVGGSRSYPGAVVLAVRAALRSGVGLVTAFVPERLAPEYAARHPEAMWVGCPETVSGGLATGAVGLMQERLARATALLMGPGMGAEPEVLATMKGVVRSTAIPLVLDADALRPEVVTGLAGRAFVCTPHAGELQRLGGSAGLRPAAEDGEVVAVL
jgi:NAD(P)H-hydrate repair Nnr-like enzyme with NAD(P)H-hydrate epimerase domain